MGKEKGPSKDKNLKGREIFPSPDGPFPSNGHSSYEQSEELPLGFETWSPKQQELWRIKNQNQDQI